MSNNTPQTFWQFISAHRIEIPIIQRDYSQGRLGQEYVRNRFLSKIKESLDSGKRLTLDFVYGTTETTTNTIQPLDGQQRLTTLWLLHWYVALKAGELPSACSVLSNFTYETRMSSREFFQALCFPENFKNLDNENIVEFIRKQTWFYSIWCQDPTIQSILRTLGGTKVKDKYGNDIIDGLEELFSDCSDFKKYWNLLISENAPIKFYYQSLEDFGLTDDLYVKMNARGKQLTAFENFKADLIGYIRKQAEEDTQWEGLLNPKEGIPIKLDTTWTDLFWKYKSADFRIDEIYYAFLNRFFWNELFISEAGKDIDDSNKINTSYNYLNEDSYDNYIGLEPYKFSNKEIPIDVFIDLNTVLDRYIKYQNNKDNHDIPTPNWGKGFEFIPKYKPEDHQVSSISQIQRIVFFAVCKYFKEGEGDEASLKRWMRVVWNLISGIDEDGSLQIRSISAMRAAIDYLGKLDSHNVYSSISLDNEKKGTNFYRRIEEEVAKADKIISNSEWEEKIIKAENWAFFHGSIGFLFRDKSGTWNWDKFDDKFKSVKKYFSEEEPLGNGSYMNDGYDNASLLKSLLKQILVQDKDNKNSEILKDHYRNHSLLNNRPGSWLFYLQNLHFCGPVHEFLLGNSVETQKQDDILATIVNDPGLLDYIVVKIPDALVRGMTVHKSYARDGIYLDRKERDSFLSEDGISVDKYHIINNSAFLYGWSINFTYSNYHFQWHYNNIIYLSFASDLSGWL